MTAPAAQANRPDPSPDAHTGLPIYITPTVFDLAARKFGGSHFSEAMREFKRGDKARLQRQVFRVFRDAVPHDSVKADAAFIARISTKFRLPNGNLPQFVFRANQDILFICVINETGGADRKGQLAAISLAKIDQHTGRVVLEAQQPQFTGRK